MIKEPPVTPQELRKIAQHIDPGIYKLDRENRELLERLADWLEQHMPLYREAVDLLPRMRPNQNDHGWPVDGPSPVRCLDCGTPVPFGEPCPTCGLGS